MHTEDGFVSGLGTLRLGGAVIAWKLWRKGECRLRAIVAGVVFEHSLLQARLLLKYKHKDGILSVKVTNDVKVCYAL